MMTEVNPLSLPIGRQLDQMIAENVMGWIWCEALGEKWLSTREELAKPPENPFAFTVFEADLSDETLITQERWWLDDDKAHLGPIVPHYSTDMSAAWQVVMYFREQGWHLELSSVVSAWYVELLWPHGQGRRASAASTSPTGAICLAALGAIREAQRS